MAVESMRRAAAAGPRPAGRSVRSAAAGAWPA